LLDGEIATRFLSLILAKPQVRWLLSSDHFSVDGTLIDAWCSMKSFRPKEDAGDDGLPGDGPGGRNAEVDFRVTCPLRIGPFFLRNLPVRFGRCQTKATAHVRCRTRQERSQPLVDALPELLDAAQRRLSPESDMARAIAYGTKRWLARNAIPEKSKEVSRSGTPGNIVDDLLDNVVRHFDL
jgi:hypothetical protein